MKIILVSQQPPGRKGAPLDGAGGRRLASLANIDHQAWLDRFEHASLATGDRLGAQALIERADQLRVDWYGRRVVLIGETVAAAFRLRKDEDYSPFQQIELPPGFEVAVMPDPSRASAWWNDGKNVEAARQFMQRLNVGFLAINRAGTKAALGRPEHFTPEQVAAALKATDGLLLQAADLLTEETGVHTSRHVVANYCERYPALQSIRVQCREAVGDMAERNVGQAVRDGDVETSRWLLRSNMFTGRGYGLHVEGRVRHSGSVDHVHKLDPRLERLHATLTDAEVDVLEGVYTKLEELTSDDAERSAAESDEGTPPRVAG